MKFLIFVVISLLVLGFASCDFESLADSFATFLKANKTSYELNSLNLTSINLSDKLQHYRRLSELTLAQFISDNRQSLALKHLGKKRFRRQTEGYKLNIDKDLEYLSDQTGVYRLRGIYPVSKLCPLNKQLLHFNTIRVNISTLTVCLTETRLVIGELSQSSLNTDPRNNLYKDQILWSNIAEYNGHGFRKVNHFVSNKQLYFIIAKSDVGMPLLKLDLRTFKLVLQDQQTMSTNPTTLKVWRPKTWKPNHQSAKHLVSGETWSLAVANTYSNLDSSFDMRKKRSTNKTYTEQVSKLSKRETSLSEELISNVVEKKKLDQNRLNSFRSYISLFYFDSVSNYFDEYDRIPSYFVRDLCPFTINNYDYLAVINFKSGVNNHKVNSEIFKFDLQDGKWKSIQKLATYGAVSCEFFKFKDKRSNEEEYFLAIANNHDIEQNNLVIYEVNSIIYKFFYDQFVPFQCLKTFGASSIQMIRKKNLDNDNLENYEKKSKKLDSDDADEEELVLAIATLNGVQLYQYNGWKFHLSRVQYVKHSMGPTVGLIPSHLNHQRSDSVDLNQIINNYLFNSNLLYSFGFNNKLYLLASNRKYLMDINCFRLTFSFENVLGQWYLDSKKWCQNLVGKLNNKNDQIFFNLNNELGKVLYVDQKHPIVLEELRVLGNFSIDQLKSPVVNDIYHKKNYSIQFVHGLINVNNKLSQLNYVNENINRLLHRTIKLKTNQLQEILVPLTFENLFFNCTQSLNCVLNSIRSNIINNYDLTNLNDKIIRINRPDNVPINEITINKVTLANNLELRGKLNRRLNLNNFITKSTKLVDKAILFKNKFYTNKIRADLINGLPLNQETVLLKNKNQDIHSNLVFNGPVRILGDLMIDGKYNRMSKTMNEMIESVVTKYSDTKIFSNKYFVNGLFGKNMIMTETSTCNGVNLVDFYDDLFWVNRDLVLNNPINFTNINIHGDLNVKGLINNISIPNNDLILENRKSIIFGKKIFKTNLFIKELNLMKSLNNVSLVGNRLDLFMRNVPQRVFGIRKFKTGIELNKNAGLIGLLNNVKLNDLKRDLERDFRNNHFQQTVIINGDVDFENDLIVENLINNVNFNSLVRNGLRLNETVIRDFGEIYFSSIITPQSQGRLINRFDIEKDFLFKSGFQVIRAPKLFKSFYAFNELDINFFNQFDIRKESLLSNYLFKDGGQYIEGRRLIKGNIFIENLIVSNLNGINMKRLFALHGNQALGGQINVANVISNSNIVVTDVINANYVNEISLEDLIKNSLHFDLSQTILGSKKVLKLFVPRKSNLQVDYLNNLKMENYFNSIVYRDVPGQVVRGKKIFLDDVYFGNVDFTNSWDRISALKLKNDFIYKNDNQKIYGNLIFIGNVIFEGGLGLKSNLLNNYPISWINSSIVRTDMPVVFENELEFNNVVFGKNAHVDGKINGLQLGRDLILSNTLMHHNLVGSKSFKKVVVRHHLVLKSGFINYHDVNRLCLNAVRKNTKNSILINAPTVILGNLNVNEFWAYNRFNNLNLLNFTKNQVLDYNSNKNYIVRGRKHFNTLILDGPSQLIGGGFSGIDLNKLNDTYLSLSRNQKIFSDLHFNDELMIKNLIVKGNLNTRLINGVDLIDLEKNSLRVDGDQVINTNLVFTGNVKIFNNMVIPHGVLNRIRINQDLMLKTRPINIVYNNKRFNAGAEFEKVTTKQSDYRQRFDITEVSTGNTLNLQMFLESAIFNNDRFYNVSGEKVFDYIKVDDLIINGPVNGIPFDSKNFIVNRPGLRHIIRDNFVFKGDLLVDSSIIVRGLVNQNNLSSFIHDLVLKNAYENVIISDKMISGKLSVNNLTVYGSVHGYDLNDLSRKVNQDLFSFDYKKKNLLHSRSNLDKLQRSLEMN